MVGRALLPGLAAMFLLAVAEAPAPGQNSSSIPGGDTPAGQETARKLDTIIVPKIDFNGMNINAVVDFLTLKSKELDPEHAGVQFTAILPPSGDPKASHVHYEVTLSLENVPLGAVLEFISEQTHLSCSIVGGTVVFEML